jgi:outer membrane receptor protein involved in Fe transport
MNISQKELNMICSISKIQITRNLTALALLIAVFTITSAVALAGSITGQVKDQSGAAVAGATVKALNLASGRELTTTTNANGEFELKDVAAGLYRVTAIGEGFADSAVTLTVGDGEQKQDFSLSPGAISDTMTITAGKGSARAIEDTPQTVSVTTDTQIEQRRPISTFQALERSPNLIQAGGNPSVERPRLRGLASTRVLIVIDGERLNNVRADAGATGVSPSVVDVSQLESAEVLSSAGSSLYGSDALAGTINLVTRAPSRPATGSIFGIRFDGDYQSNADSRRGNLAVNYSNQKFAARLAGSLFRLGNARSGNKAITIDEVIALGRFGVDLATPINNGANVARTYAVWSLPANGEIANSQGHGGNGQIDLWFYPSEKHNLRYRQLNSQHYSIGQAFLTPPYDPLLSFNGFRRLDKYGVRYEGREFNSWLVRMAGGFYRQKFSSPQDQTTVTITPGSSYTGSTFTGRPSIFSFAGAAANHNKNSITSYGADIQATMLLFKGAIFTTGFAYLEDQSRDEFARFTYSATGQPTNFVAGATNPNSNYKDKGWFNLIEYDPVKWLHLTGGIRLDNWKTEGLVTRGFPLGNEATILNASLNALRANPGAIQLNGLNGALDLAAGRGKLETNNTITTGNMGVVVKLPWGISPYYRWGNSYREPSITERYIIRNFGTPSLSVPLVSNTILNPERGKNHDIGVRFKGNNWNASLGYFRNNLSNFIRSAFSPLLCIPANPAAGLVSFPAPPCAATGSHGVQYVQRINSARARIQGIEATAEYAISLRAAGSLTPFTSIGSLKGTDLTPQANDVTIINARYNGSTLIQLKGSPTDVPLPSISPFRAVFGAYYTDIKANWFAEYQARYQARVRRANPVDITSTNTTQYGTFASLAPFTRQSARVGYTLRREVYRVSFTFGVENLTDRLYFEHFQNTPAPGRSFVFGITTDFFNLLKK